MALNDIMSEVAERLGLKDTHLDTLRRRQMQLSENIRTNYDKLEALKNLVDDLDSKLKQKKNEYDLAGPGKRLIIKQELRLLFEKQDRIIEPIKTFSDQISRYELEKDKINTLIFAEENPSRIEDIEDMTADLEEWLDGQKDAARASKKLAATSYSSQQEDEAEIDFRINSIDGVGEAVNETHSDSFDERIAQLG